ncbi:hypothetical protein VKS41_002299 [Umbelopsis sp. WA50703]
MRSPRRLLIGWHGFRTAGNRHRFFIVLTIGFLIQWCGNALISYYLSLLLTTIGITDTRTKLIINVGINLNGMLWGNLFSLVIERFGRRPMLLGGLTGMFGAFVILTAVTAVNSNVNFKNDTASQASVAMIFVFGLFYKAGPAFVINGFADAAANVFNGFANPVALTAIGWKYYIVWVCILVSNFFLVYFFYPETKGLSLEEVSMKFDKDQDQLNEHEPEKNEVFEAPLQEKQ